ncbi:SusC/RagA family TonB-linked outer membrane protein [Adhaeribacter aerolatus]|uniref:SusC/RagA family TonB-linked outer membrane protein n=2 Tax=Adhaeribacter aerolatus TaxID=670289 RepID=A0A512B3F4_9BACT|nr:SusC/RagA family TonB-linked outer membrane protein [Adhaeribacter aerolatus]
MQQADFLVKGKVTDNTGAGLPGVSVLVKGTNLGTTTNFDGTFSLSVPDQNGTLIFSFIGFVTQEIPLNGQTIFSVKLLPDAKALEEVVVVGYGTQKKTSLTTAVASVSGKELTEQAPSGDLRKVLQGVAPGLTVLDNGGQPGNNKIQMQIRGISSVNGSEPLVLVDGQVQSLNDIDPNSVESVSILKDAASTAIYGSRGANGIILITTKKGKKGPLKINYEGVYGLQDPTVLPDFMNTEEYLRYRNVLAANQKKRNPNSSLPTYTEQEIQDYLAGMETDPIKFPAASYNMRDIYRTAPQTRHSLTLTGGGDFVQSMANVSYFYQEGLIWERTYERINLRLNNNFKLHKTLNAHLNLYYQNAERKTQATGFAEYEAIQGLHNQTQKYGLGGGLIYDADGNYIPKGARKTNPRLEADTDYMGLRKNTPRFYTIDAGLDWEPVEGLTFTGKYGVQNTSERESYNIPKWNLGFAAYNNNSLYFNNGDVTRTTLNLLANYQKSFKRHNISALAGYAVEEFKDEWQDMLGQNFFNNEIINIGTGTQENYTIRNGLNEWGLRSYFGRVGYNFDDRYFAEVSLRSDGSSRFPTGRKYSQFPGAALAWRVSGESFWEKFATVVNDFKIRYSYGQTGSHDGIGNYAYIPQLALSQGYGFTTGPGGEYVVNTVIQNNMASENLSWEKVTQHDAGVDLAFLQNKLNVTFDVFDKTTNGILLDLPIPGVIGLNAAKTNAGVINNKGWEFSTSWRSSVNGLNYNLGAGVASVEDKLVDYAGLGITVLNGMYYRAEGTPLYAIRGYKTVGIYQTDDEAKSSANVEAWAKQIGAGDYKFEDVNQDGKIDPNNDFQYLGDRTPKYTFNLNLGADWKGFDLNMLWNGAAKVQTVITGTIGEVGQYNNSPIITYFRNNYWTKEGDTDVYFSRPLWQANNNLEPNSKDVHNADYFRLKSLVFGYTLPTTLTQRIALNKVRVYFSGTNLLTISSLMKNWGVDPEDAPVSGAWQGLISGDSNATRHIYPAQLKTFNFGVNIQL